MHIRRILSLVSLAVCLFLRFPVACYGSGEHKEAPHHMENKDAMKAQHERMANFKEAADMISNAIIHSAPQLAHDGAEKLNRALEGHESSMPHKNRSHVKEFHRLFVELGKRTEKLKSAIKADDLPKSAVAYGRILEICATCHMKFRD
ncbi:MAG: cytochrome c [Deltaproteobacteria bacterium]|nr:cytochrome c [Deltaproteobacteria bacterium]